MERTRKVRNQVASNSAQPKDVRLLMDFFAALMKENKYECLQNGLIIPDTKINTIGSNGIASKRNQYTNINAFLADIDQLARSYMVHFENKSQTKYQAAKSFKEKCHTEAKTIRKCCDCYEYWNIHKTPKNYFKFVCSKPHLLVFVKVDGFPIWPAKLFSVDDEKMTGNIECFGDYLEDDVPLERCYLYSTGIRHETSTDPKKQMKLKRGYKEVEEHIKNIEAKFGSFKPAPPMITISNLQQHLIDMFPGAYAQSSNTTDDRQSQATPAETPAETQYDADDAEEPFFGEPSTSNRANRAMRRNTARNTNIDDNNFEEFDNSIKSEIEIGEVIANYQDHIDATEPDNDSEANSGDSIMNESQPMFEVKPEYSAENDQNKSNRKRQAGRSGVMKMQAGSVPYKKSKASGMGNSSQANGEEVVTISDDETEKWREYDEINKTIYHYEIEIENLKKRKESLQELLRKKTKK